MIQADLNIILPEILLSVYAMGALIAVVYTGKDKMAVPLTWATAAVFAVLAFLVAGGTSEAQSAFGGMFINDNFARFAKVVILVSAAAVLIISQDYMSRHNLLKFEYPILIALATVGMMMMVSAGDLMALYMGLELQSLA
jgi:NADH-quinone oxidoreductase subunit N